MRSCAPAGTLKRSPSRIFMYGLALGVAPPLVYETSPAIELTRPTSSAAKALTATSSAAPASIWIVFFMVFSRGPTDSAVSVMLPPRRQGGILSRRRPGGGPFLNKIYLR